MKKLPLIFLFSGFAFSSFIYADLPENFEQNATADIHFHQIDSIILEGKTYKVNDLLNDFMGKVEFEQGTAELTKNSYTALNKLIEVMKINTAIRVEVGCHIGNLENHPALKLSQKRAGVIKQYFQDEGVKLGHIVPIGFGRTRQIEGKSSERTEFLIITLNDND